MKLLLLSLLAVTGSAFVLPSEDVFANIAVEDQSPLDSWREKIVEKEEYLVDELHSYWTDVKESAYDIWDTTQEAYHHAADDAFEQANAAVEFVGDSINDAASDVLSWAEDDADRPKRPHDPHHREPTLTVYQLIAGSKYTTKLAGLINEYDDLVDLLNSTKANYTVFAPTDKAFERIPEDAPKPPKEFIKALLAYHVIPGVWPASRVLRSNTAPTYLKSKSLGNQPRHQRVSFQLGLRGLTVNFFNRVVAINIAGTNGVIHGLDSILVPPPGIIRAIDLFPGEFSTLELGLQKTGLLDKFNNTDHPGGTLFAPSNFAFQKLGPRANAFLFSPYGLKYLKALLQYHAVPARTLYSDAYYDSNNEPGDDDDDDSDAASAPNGYFHLDLPTFLEGREIAVDVGRYGRWVTIKLNAFSRVTVPDGAAKDGVIHVISNVLIPPKKLGSAASGEDEYWQGGEISPEELVERLAPLVAKDDL